MEGVLVSVATGVLKPVLGKLAALVGDKYKHFKDVRGEIKSLTHELATMDAFLMNMSEEEDPNLQDKVWMDEVRELSYEMEDCIDDFMISVGDKDTKPDGIIEKIKSSLWKMKARHRIGNEIKDLKKQITEVGEKNARYKSDVGKRSASHKTVEALSETINGTVDTRALVIFDHVSNIVGIDGSKREIVNLLTKEDGCGSTQKLHIVSIVGSGGMGKTTLANQVYQDLRGGFHYGAFISVSRSPNMMSILRIILSQVSNKPFAGTEEGSVQQLAINIHEFLVKHEKKKYFIVVDDIWDIDTWDVIKCAFPMTSAGSRIITTTRINSVAEACSSSFNGHIYPIRPLGIAHSRRLFYRRLFDSEEHCPSHLQEISNEILQKCGGLPLAIIAVSGLLASKPKSACIWNEVKNSIGCALERNRSVESMMKILSLSYFDLPSLLKTCLLYLGIFPENAIIKKNGLIRSWIAEGFIQKESRYTEHEVGEMCFNELVNRSLVQLVTDKHHNRNTCRVHDIVLDFIVSKSIENNFVTLVGVPFVPINGERKVRRLSLQVGTNENFILPTSLVLSNARSLNVIGVLGKILPLNEFRHLRILDFGGSLEFGNSKLTNAHIENIGRLLHLRYLSLRNTSVTELPEHIGCLTCLEMLDLRGSKIYGLPANIVNLGKLVHLFTDGAVKFPDGIVKLQALEGLKWVNFLVQEINFMQQLGQLRNLRRLFIDARKHASSFNILVSLDKLRYLKIRNGGKFFSFGIDCPVPITLLKLILIDSPFCKVPEWIPSLVNLQELRIQVKGIMWGDLCILGSLPALLKLQLEQIYVRRDDTYLTISGVVGFPCLTKFLYGIDCQGMNLNFTAGSMPNLETLHIILQPNLIERGADAFDLGIENLPKLVTLVSRVNGYSRSFETAMHSAAMTHPNRPTLLFQRTYQ